MKAKNKNYFQDLKLGFKIGIIKTILGYYQENWERDIKKEKWENVNTLGWDLENGGNFERKQEMLRNLDWITLG